MPNVVKAQVHVLDRVLYLLEENSVSHLGRHDSTFDNFISDLYAQVSKQSDRLQNESSTKQQPNNI